MGLRATTGEEEGVRGERGRERENGRNVRRGKMTGGK